MCNRITNLSGTLVWLVLAAFVVVGPTGASAQDVLKLYAASEVSPAIEEAAMAFTKRHNVRVDVTVGPPSTWLAQAKENADLVFAEDMAGMTHFAFLNELSIDRSTITPLYVRPAVILVRPGNPKKIQDLPDLVKPGVRVMVTNGAGRAGLWKELATKLGRGEMLRALNQNTVFVPGNTTDAMELWREWADIDAWITWNVWHMPLRHRAHVVPLSTDYSILRQCGIALTQRGAEKPLAVQFSRFLTSRGAADVFESWAWGRPLPSWNPLNVQGHVCVACQIALADRDDRPGNRLAKISQFVSDYQAAGVDPSDVHISAIVEGDAAVALLTDSAYATHTKQGQANPDGPAVAELLKSGVSLELSAQTMREKGWTKDDLLPGVKIVDDKDNRFTQLAQQGYTRMQL